MKHPEIKNIIKNNYKSINILSRKVIRDFKAEDIHLLRVEIKKLNAFLRMAGSRMVYIPGLNLPKKLHEFYKDLGVIRSHQLHKQRIQIILKNKNALLPLPYLNFLVNRILYNKMMAKELWKGENIFKKGRQQLLNIIPNKLSPKLINEYKNRQIQKIEKLLGTLSPSDLILHTIRKLLKDLIINWPYIKTENADLKPTMKHFHKKEINSIIELLGDYLDTCTIMAILHADIVNQETNEKEKIVLQDLETDLIKERETIRNEFIKYFKSVTLNLKQENSCK